MPTQGPNPALARRRRLIAFAVIATVVAAIATASNLASFSLSPPRISMRQLQPAAAVTHAAIEVPPARRPASLTGFESEAKRINLIGNIMTSIPVLNRVGARIGADSAQISANTQVTEDVSRSYLEPDAEHRANQIRVAGDPYKLEIQARPGLPVLDIYAQAPSVGDAESLAEAVVPAANSYLAALARHDGATGPTPVRLAQIGSPRAGPLDPTAPITIAFLTFVATFFATFGLLFALAQVRRGWLRAGQRRSVESPPPRPLSRQVDDWPHTTRFLPWMVAGFIAILWLLPINAITVQASLPVDLKLDRLVLPVIVLTWLLSLAAGGPGAPRWRFTKIHGVIAAFVAVAFLSVVFNAPYLNQLLELSLAVKKLTLLAAFFTVFLLVASVVRPSEVRPFMTLTLVLAVVCALGVLWEYRFGTNLFYTWSGRLLPGFFEVAPVDSMGVDEIGRRAVQGPADLSLELVGMLSMALPIALVRVMHSENARERLLCGLGICILLGAMVATYRKSALLAPATVFLFIAYFRRHELLRLAPLGVVLVLALPALAPNALGSVVEQLEPHRLGVSTVSDRVSDYDAIRPDVLSHLAFGRGFGSYEHTIYRVLDNDLLMRLIETGLVGLAAYVLMLLLSIAAAVPIIRRRDPTRAPPALAIAAATGAFLVLSALFDIMSFPHGPYILMTLFGFLAVLVADEERLPFRRRGRTLTDATEVPAELLTDPERPGTQPVLA